MACASGLIEMLNITKILITYFRLLTEIMILKVGSDLDKMSLYQLHKLKRRKIDSRRDSSDSEMTTTTPGGATDELGSGPDAPSSRGSMGTEGGTSSGSDQSTVDSPPSESSNQNTPAVMTTRGQDSPDDGTVDAQPSKPDDIFSDESSSTKSHGGGGGIGGPMQQQPPDTVVQDPTMTDIYPQRRLSDVTSVYATSPQQHVQKDRTSVAPLHTMYWLGPNMVRTTEIVPSASTTASSYRSTMGGKPPSPRVTSAIFRPITTSSATSFKYYGQQQQQQQQQYQQHSTTLAEALASPTTTTTGHVTSSGVLDHSMPSSISAPPGQALNLSVTAAVGPGWSRHNGGGNTTISAASSSSGGGGPAMVSTTIKPPGASSRGGGEQDDDDDTPMICMICDDKATGLHYGIITCEGYVSRSNYRHLCLFVCLFVLYRAAATRIKWRVN